MTRFWFEHWQAGSLKGVKMVEAKSVKEAVGILSDKLKGAFKLTDKQTETQRVKENWQRFYGASGE